MNTVAASFFFSAPARHRPRRAADTIGSAARRLLSRLDAAEDCRQLHGLSNHMLRDVGLMRDQIDDALQCDLRRQADRLRQLGS